MSAAYIQVHFRLDIFMEANNMNTDQTAPWEESDPGPYILLYSLQTRLADERNRRQKS